MCGPINMDAPGAAAAEAAKQAFPPKPEPSAKRAASRRRKLWEIRHELHCSIVGTCFSVPELRVLSRKAGHVVAKNRSDYEIHGMFSEVAARKCLISKFMQKALDAKYAAAVRRFSQARTEAELEALWGDAWSKRDVPGAYWATVSHPLATSRLVEQAFGEVHMLSHLSGASKLVEAQEFDELSEHAANLEAEIGALRRRLAERDKTLNEVQSLKRDLAAERRENASLRERLADSESGGALEALRASVRHLTDQVAARAVRIEKLERDLDAERATVTVLRRQQTIVVEDAFAAPQNGHPPCAAADNDDSSAPPDLLGKRVLYVGGRPQTVVHLRSLIERHNGAFLYHDGGKEERDNRLNDVLGQADLVVCPTDCVSHTACLKAKSFCKHAKKPFIVLRSASQSSLANRLDDIATQVA